MSNKWRAAAVLLSLVAPATAGELFRDDFSRYPAGWLSEPLGALSGAIQEYHYLPHRGVPLGPWRNAIVHDDAWLVGEEDGRPYLEQQEENDRKGTEDHRGVQIMNPTFITGDPEWSDYTLEVRVKPLSLAEMAGVVFRYRTNRHYYLFSLSGGNRARLALRLPMEKEFLVAAWRELGQAEFRYDTKRYYDIRVENHGPKIRAFVDGKLLIEASDGEILKGRAGLTANVPARFQDFRVSAAEQAEREIRRRIAAREAELAALRKENPAPKLWKKFETPGFGSGRNARFGDLDGDGVIDMLIAQRIPRVRSNAYEQISCLTAVTLDGRILWQKGKPDPRNGLLTNDTPFQIHDVDGDGKADVLVAMDFKLQLLDGRTGEVKKWTWMPEVPRSKRRPYEMVNGDSILFLNFLGDKRRREFLIKDRMENFWVYDRNLNLLWKGAGHTGHYPYPVDVDGDGRDELFIGYAMWNHEGGQPLWTRDPELEGKGRHADALVAGNFSGNPGAEPRVYAAGSDLGFVVLDLRGRMLRHHRVGHAQSISVGRFRPELPGLQILTANFWRNPGIVTMLNADGDILAQEEPIHSGSLLLPVNWRGDGQEFALLSGNAHEGGMIDGHFRRVVMFPDDGHPDLAAYVLNLTGDERDEVVLMDQERVWIYTQDQPFKGKRIYAPVRNPLYNESNYRANVSRPRWRN